jgi:hypothetical protein
LGGRLSEAKKAIESMRQIAPGLCVSDLRTFSRFVDRKIAPETQKACENESAVTFRKFEHWQVMPAD